MKTTPARVAVFPLFLLITGVSLGTNAIAQPDPEAAPPANEPVVREVQAGGAQIYECRSTPTGSFQWSLTGPKALLINDDGSDFGTHSSGPTWTALDGSTISADSAHPLVKIDRPHSVPAVLLRVTSVHGDGILSGVRFVRRSDTAGGLAPATGCDAAHANATTASHYSAVYTFYR